MNVFLTGATGYVGSAIASSLVRAKHDVTALVRSSTSAARVASYGIHAHCGDLREPSTYRDAALAADVIVHAGVESRADRIDVDRVFESGARGVFHAVTEVLRARDVFPGKGVPLAEARAQLGGFADALALDQDVRAVRSASIGWTPTQRFSAS